MSDTISRYEIVLPDATIQNVTKDSDPDLFWALKAGTNNFGIVTNVQMKAIPYTPTWRSDMYYDWTKVSEILSLNHELFTKSTATDPDAMAWCAFSYVPDYNMYLIVKSSFHVAHATNETWPKAFQPYQSLEAIPGSQGARVGPMSRLIQDADITAMAEKRSLYKSVTLKPSVDLQQKILDMYQDAVEPVKDVPGLVPAIIFQPIPVRMMGQGDHNPFGLDPSEGPLVNFLLSWSWDGREDDGRIESALLSFSNRAETMAAEMGLLHRFIYPNYAWQDQDTYASFGEENASKMRLIQSRVDPLGIFNRNGLCGGYFKLNDNLMANEQVGSSGGKTVKDEL